VWAPDRVSGVYLTPFTTLDDDDPHDHAEIVALVEATGVAQVITTGPDGVPAASLLPILWDGGDRLVAHASRANPQFADLAADAPALAVVTGPDAYVHPTWYPSTAASGRAVPTWNYLAVHLSGTVRLHRDPEWLLAAVTRLSERHAPGHLPSWTLAEAPGEYVRGLLHGIIGVELTVNRVEGKAKLSGNRVDADRLGVARELAREGAPGAVGVAREMARRLTRPSGG